jgi:membrane protein
MPSASPTVSGPPDVNVASGKAAPARGTGSDRGRNATSPWHLPPAGWKDVLIRTAKEASTDNVGLVAAGVSFYGFLALVPLLGSVVLIYGFVADPRTVAQHMASMMAVMPADVARLIGEQLMNVVQTSSGKKGLGMLLALGIALFGARNAAGAIITALNIAYEEEEKRGFLKTHALALGMTSAAVVLAVVALLAIGGFVYLEDLLPGLHPLVAAGSKIASYVVLALVAAAAAAALYRFGPSRDDARWAWLTPGSVLFALAWVAVTLGFGFYVSKFGNYNATYGSLAAIVVLLTWMYLSSYALIFGAELNSELEHQTARDTTKGPEQPLGQRGAWAADHVAPRPAPPREK